MRECIVPFEGWLTAEIERESTGRSCRGCDSLGWTASFRSLLMVPANVVWFPCCSTCPLECECG
jgi:hypothetical protein